MTHRVAVVTGGSGGVGLRAARLLAHDHHVVLSDVHGERLVRALDRLDSTGVSAESIVADVTDRSSVAALMAAARQAGPVATVVHAGGTLDLTASPEAIVRRRVLGTINVTVATLAVAGPGTTLVHASPSGPVSSPTLPRWVVRLAPTDPEGLVTALTRLSGLWPAGRAPAAAHTLSTSFLQGYTARMGEAFEACGARLWSASAESALDLCRADLAAAA